MINRELRPALLLTYDSDIDDYGQVKQNPPIEQREIEATLRIYQHSKVEDVRFNDVTHIALTLDKDITEANRLQIGSTLYSIEFVNPEGRMTQVFLKRYKDCE